ncbi:MAG: methyltransferase [Deltaproteobacteria bacterium RBG_16_47_11]|nr:MAG: methyltransferase [Deltaproteobacteria bacterium RBG_16_47_11]
MADAEKFYTAISQGNMDEVKKLTQAALDGGEMAETILKDGLLPAMEQIGIKFKNNEIYIPEVLIAARAMHAGMAILKPILSKSTATQAVKVIVGTVKGDLHDIGKNLVVMMLEGGGFEAIDIGVDVPPDKFVEAIKKHQPRVVGMSALLTTTMREMKNTLEAIQEAGLRKQVKAIIGGAPITDRYAKEIGADGYAPDAATAVDLVKSLIAKA